jgi:hypothetical protein
MDQSKAFRMKILIQTPISYQAFLRHLVAESKANGNSDCFLAKMLREKEKNGLDEEHIAHIGTTMVSTI